jgi:hypothetical protein
MFTVPAAKEHCVIPDAQYWKDLRAAYAQVKAGLDDEVDEEDYWLADALRQDPPETGALIDYEIRQGQYGRGVYVQQDVLAGSPVWKCQHCGVFRNEQQWLDFLRLLPPHMQYDVVEWAYVTDGEVYLDFDPGSLKNHGYGSGSSSGSSTNNAEGFANVRPANLSCVEIPDTDEEWQYIANVDIKAGEELLCDYTTFHDYANPLSWFVASNEQIVKRGIYYH